MTSWLGSLWGSSSSVPYSLSADPLFPSSSPGSHGWAIHSATRKHSSSASESSTTMTAFKASKAELAHASLLIPALHHFHHLKRLIHPRILRVHYSLDSDYPGDDVPVGQKTASNGTLLLVTERVDPLTHWLDSLDPSTTSSNAEAVAWGLSNLVEALSFLHNQANLAHGNLSPHAVFVTPAGDFKLGAFHLVTPMGILDGGGGPTPHFRTYEGQLCPQDYRSPERLNQHYHVLQQAAPIHAIDCYALAVLIQYIYSHPSVSLSGTVPSALQKALQRMKADSPKLRPRLAPLLKCPVFDNAHVHAQTALDELMTKPMEEKIRFLQTMPDILQRKILNLNVATHKLLPLLVLSLKAATATEAAITQDVHRRELLAILPLLFIIAESSLANNNNNNPEWFHTHITPLVPTLFAINDRGVRGAILQKIALLERQLDNNQINTHVFEPMCSGFTDSSAPLRELTLKSTMVLVPKLHPANLEKLVRYLVRLQSDTEPSIRTNTVIFIGKVAPSLTPVSRQKLILPAFTRAMKDPFVPCRHSALKAILTSREYFSVKEVAEKVLPCVVPHLLDGAREVREEAFRVGETLLESLREESQRMAREEGDKGSLGEPNSEGVVPAAPLSGGYLSGLSSWMVPSVEPVSSGGSVVAAKPVSEEGESVSSSVIKSSVPSGPKFSSLSLSDAQIGGASKMHANDYLGGWENNDGGTDAWGEEDFATNVHSPQNNQGSSSSILDDDIFASLEVSRPTNPLVAKQSGMAIRHASSRPFASTSKLIVKKQQPKPVVKKLPANDLLTDGWDDF